MLSAQTTYKRTREAVYRQRHVELLSENFAVCYIEGSRNKEQTLERKQKTKKERYSLGPSFSLLKK